MKMMLVLDSAFLAGKVLYVMLSLDCSLELAASLNQVHCKTLSPADKS